MVCKFVSSGNLPFKLVSFILTMWYVNILDNGEALKIEACFILTMWYVNKGDKGDPGTASTCFILTMWYVNSVSYITWDAQLEVLY